MHLCGCWLAYLVGVMEVEQNTTGSLDDIPEGIESSQASGRKRERESSLDPSYRNCQNGEYIKTLEGKGK